MNSKILIAALFVVAVCASPLVVNPTPAVLQANDVNAMRYAITLENLEATFYNTMQTRFNASAFAAAGLPGVYDIFTLIQNHENAHVDFINATMRALGLTAPTACTYNFGTINTVQQYIATAALFENVGVSAYDGAINTVFNNTVVQALATVATIEARHASYLNGLNNSMPIFLPNNASVDIALPPATVGAAISPFLTCSYNVTATFPALYTVVPITNTTDPSINTLIANDFNALNYALFLEHLEAAFYVYGQGRFNAAAFAAAGLDASVRPNIDLISAHETAHVTFLTSAITTAGGSPVPACTYNFASVVTDVRSYIAVAALLEATGVSAYDGAVNTIYNAAYKQAAATIATVEARHSSYLNSLNSSQPVPVGGFDVALSPSAIATAVFGLNVVTSCPNNYQTSLPLPQAYQLSAASNTTATTGTTATGSTTTTTTTTRTATATTTTTRAATTTTTSAASAVPVTVALVFGALLATL